MEITLYTALWLLSGFLAAWVDHKYVYDEKLDTPLGLTLIIAAGGLGSLVVALARAIKTNPIVIFKAKGPK